MRFLLIALFFFFTGSFLGPSTLEAKATTPPSHQPWTELLQQHVSPAGVVDYEGFARDKAKLQRYLQTISNSPPDRKSWSAQEQLAYWINAYNAFTVKLILEHYPVKSIRDIKPAGGGSGENTVWHRKFFRIGVQETSLNEIEHSILRKQFAEPRIHFAVNCASVSCPPLRNEAYVASRLDRQLDEQARRFINNPQYNKLSPNKAQVSQLFDWFKGDFTKNGSLVDFLNQYARVQVRPNAKITYLTYDWNLNN